LHELHCRKDPSAVKAMDAVDGQNAHRVENRVCNPLLFM